MESSTIGLGLMSFGSTKIAVKGGTWKGRRLNCGPALPNLGEPSWNWIPQNHIQIKNEKDDFVVAC